MLRRIFDWFMERIKAFSDTTLAFLLRSTSWFGRELTQEGRAEQDMWREQRLRNIRGLGLISRRRQMRQQGK
ncbi:MAG: hypothetical protein ACE10C_05795 [Candidatus Binatia bacterium]